MIIFTSCTDCAFMEIGITVRTHITISVYVMAGIIMLNPIKDNIMNSS